MEREKILNSGIDTGLAFYLKSVEDSYSGIDNTLHHHEGIPKTDFLIIQSNSME